MRNLSSNDEETRTSKKYQEKLSLIHLTFEQVVDKVLTYTPKREKEKIIYNLQRNKPLN